MRYRIWHLLVAMTLVALWLSLSRWLLALEAMDHPNKPQTNSDFVGFYLGSTTLVGLPMAWIALRMKSRSKRFTTSARNSRIDV
jgi:hypothetical protein